MIAVVIAAGVLFGGCSKYDPNSLNARQLERKLRSTEEKILIYFWQPDCAGCDYMEPLLAEMQKSFPHVGLAKVNVTQHDDLQQLYHVRATPTFIVMKKGRMQGRADSAFKDRNAFFAWLKPSKSY